MLFWDFVRTVWQLCLFDLFEVTGDCHLVSTFFLWAESYLLQSEFTRFVVFSFFPVPYFRLPLSSLLTDFTLLNLP